MRSPRLPCVSGLSKADGVRRRGLGCGQSYPDPRRIRLHDGVPAGTMVERSSPYANRWRDERNYDHYHPQRAGTTVNTRACSRLLATLDVDPDGIRYSGSVSILSRRCCKAASVGCRCRVRSIPSRLVCSAASPRRFVTVSRIAETSLFHS